MPIVVSPPIPCGFVRAKSASRFFTGLGRFYMREQPEGHSVHNLPVYGLHVRPKHSNRHGTGHGGFLATLADSFMAGFVSLGFNGRRMVTTDLKIKYLRPARIGQWLEGHCIAMAQKGDYVVVTCDLMAEGKRICRAEARFKLLAP